MKPTRNRIFCSAIRRPKMLFESQEKADSFIRYNAAEMGVDGDQEFIPIRSYYCSYCGGWHITHQPVTRRQQYIDNTQETAYQLERFVMRLKKTYANTDWKKWEPQMETAYEWVAALGHLTSFHNFLIEMKRQLRHYQSMIDSAQEKEENLARHETNLLTSKRKRLFESIRDSMSELDLATVRNSARELIELMDEPLYARFEPEIKKECESLTICFRDKDLYTHIKNIFYSLTELKGLQQYTPANELRKKVDELSARLSGLRDSGVHEYILHPLNETIVKLMQKLVNREAAAGGAVPGAGESLPSLYEHYDVAKRHLVDCINALMEGDRQSAIISLTAADDCLKSIPVSPEKIELMTLFMQVVQSGKLFEVQ